jgi:hypothetical protein
VELVELEAETVEIAEGVEVVEVAEAVEIAEGVEVVEVAEAVEVAEVAEVQQHNSSRNISVYKVVAGK